MTRLALALLFFGWILAGCNPAEPPPPTGPRDIPFRVDGVLDFVRQDGSMLRIAIEIADNDSARQRGLMERRSLPERSGMLFLMERNEPQGFWMRNTYIPLDILYVNDSLRIVNIARNTAPLSPDLIPSDGPAQFVVEVRGGFTEQNRIEPGDRIQWRRQAPQ